MEKFFKWLNGRQPWVKALVFGALFLVMVVAFASFLFKGDAEVVEEERSVALQVQDATNDNSILSNLDMYKKESYNSGEMDPNQYWNQLLEEASRDSSSVRDNTPESVVAPGKGGRADVYLDPMVYSDMEIMMIRNGSATKEEIDRRHAKEAAAVRQMTQSQFSQQSPAQIQRERDSIYWARADRMYRMIAGDAQNQKDVRHDTIYIGGPEPDTVQLAKIGTEEISSAGGNSSIISSLEDGEKEMSLEYKGGRTTPSKATFFKTESLLDGQRVVMRLMQDLKLPNGKVVPANTHVSGICSTGKRLKIKVNTVQYGGNIYYVDMCVYDNDGIEGIYCPVTEQKQSRKARKSLGRQLVNDVASTAAGLFSTSPLAARMAQTNINTMSQIAFEDGSVAVNIVSGYEFYIAEAPKR